MMVAVNATTLKGGSTENRPEEFYSSLVDFFWNEKSQESHKAGIYEGAHFFSEIVRFRGLGSECLKTISSWVPHRSPPLGTVPEEVTVNDFSHTRKVISWAPEILIFDFECAKKMEKFLFFRADSPSSIFVCCMWVLFCTKGDESLPYENHPRVVANDVENFEAQP